MHINITAPKFRNTSRVSTRLLKQVVRFATPPKCGRVRIWFKRCRRGYFFSGRCYGRGGYVSCRIPDPRVQQSIYHSSVGNGYMDWRSATYEEALVALVAHELRHLWQGRNPNGRRVWGTRGRCYSERDADAYAIRRMREWRRTMPTRLIARQPGRSLGRFRCLALPLAA